MSIIGYIIVFTLLGSIGSLIGGILLLYTKNFALRISHYLAAFAAGTLLAGAFLDLLPEALEHAAEGGRPASEMLMWVLGGILLFFLLERFIHWFHHAHLDIPDDRAKPTIPLVIMGDTMHNFVDGLVIGATFLVSVPLGIITTIAVAAHEIPQEIGDFGILLHKGVRKWKIIVINVMSAAISLVGALTAYFLGERIEGLLPIFLSVTAGFFIYIALADLIPEIHHEHKKRIAYLETVMVFIGIFLVYLLISSLSHGH